MTNVDQEPYLIFIHFTFPLFHFELQPGIFSFYSVTYHQIAQTGRYNHHESDKPKRFPPRWNNLYLQYAPGLAPNAVFRTTRSHYPICTCRQSI